MAKVTRRRILGTAAAATALGLAGGVQSATGSRNKIVVLSDVHIGDNTPTVWYQQRYHEPYLAALLDHVVERADEITELVILGDFVDFWTYPPDRRPPSFTDISAANPGIFGPSGKLTAAVKALQGRVSYVPGNHDMSITQADLDSLPLARGNRINLHGGEVYLPAAGGGRLLMAHGNRWTMFNAPDLATRLAPLPIGHFATRSFCHMLQRTLKPGQTVADLATRGSRTASISARFSPRSMARSPRRQ
jgi:UDP-2,3-diacylglucosamine pyrophosphatase LpxH